MTKKTNELHKIINYIYDRTGLKHITIYDLENYKINLLDMLKIERISYKESLLNDLTEEKVNTIKKTNFIVNQKLKKLEKESSNEK